VKVSTQIIIDAVLDTLYMVSISLFFGAILGFILGVVLVVTRKGHILENKLIFSIVNPIVNTLRSIPFIILLVAIIPFTRLLVGTAIGTTAAIVPLVLILVPITMKSAAKCDKQCELQNSANHQILERNWR